MIFVVVEGLPVLFLPLCAEWLPSHEFFALLFIIMLDVVDMSVLPSSLAQRLHPSRQYIETISSAEVLFIFIAQGPFLRSALQGILA